MAAICLKLAGMDAEQDQAVAASARR